jgi:hypothetical protein
MNKERTAVDEQVFQDYVKGGYKPLPEEIFTVDSRTFQKATLDRIQAMEGPFSYFGHRNTWRNMHKQLVFTARNVRKTITNEISEYLRYRLGISPQGVDVPAGVDAEGKIVDPKGPAIITGSGPSLDSLDGVIDKWGGAVFCSMGNQVSTVVKYGGKPTHILNFDSQLAMDEVVDLPIKKDVKILTHPGIHPEVNAYFKNNQMYWYRVYTPNDPGVSKLVRVAYDFIHPTHFPFSCAISGQTAFAHYMGYDPLIFVGCDYAFTETQARFTEWTCKKKGRKLQWSVNQPRTPEEDSKNVPLMQTKMGKLTHYIHQFYAKTTMGVYWLDGPNIIDCSDGLLNGLLPKHRIQDVVASQGRSIPETDLMTQDQIREHIGPWLAKKGAFYIPFAGGWKLVETLNWKEEIPKMLGVLKSVDDSVDEEAIMRRCEEAILRFDDIDYGENNNV